MRLLLLLEREEFSVAELSAITQLAQPRVSTHLARLREAGLVSDRRDGVSVYYRMPEKLPDAALAELWRSLRMNAQDPLVEQDADRIPQVLAARHGGGWADTVAGDMERHYSPGRTWEATARALVHLVRLGRVVDIASGDGVLAELLAPHADHVLCLDISERVVDAGRQRLKKHANVQFKLGDMHRMPLEDSGCDTVLLMHALTYTRKPQQVFQEASRVLAPGGKLLAVTLHRHPHEKAVQPYDHVNLGFTEKQLGDYIRAAGLKRLYCATSSTEKRAPNFSILTLLAEKE